MSVSLTRKGEQTRTHILETALKLFIARGYDETTMREIATEAGCSLGLTYRYFERKEDLVMALYYRLAGEFVAQVNQFEPASAAELLERTMLAKLQLLAPYKHALGALFGVAMNPNSNVAVLGDESAELRQMGRAAYVRILSIAQDAPRKAQLEQLATILYGAHLAMILFWLYDRDPDYKATRELIAFARSTLSLIRPVLVLPPISKSLTRLAKLVGKMVGES